MAQPASLRPAPVRRPWRSYKERLSLLARQVVDAQRPIRVLNAIRWPPEIFEQFKASGFREPPRLGAAEYAQIALGFDPKAKRAEFRELEAAIDRELGEKDAIGSILSATAREYRLVVEMLEARGTPGFYALSRDLYGSARDCFADGVTQVRDIALDMYDILTQLDDSLLGPMPVRNIPAERVVELLNQRLERVFGGGTVSVVIDDGILADAAAGSDYVKVRQAALFSERDIRVLEVHEGWAHVATSLNGQLQPVAHWLAKGPPRTAAAQEGLAALLEVLTLASYPHRARRLNDRVLATDKAEDGASFLEVFDWFRTEGYDEEICFWNTQRVFRGGVLDGGAPFTKDIVYTKGIVQNYNFMQSAIAAGRPELIRWMFVGKVALDDIPVLAQRAHEGVVHPPRYLPEIFSDLNGLAIWLGVSTFWGRLNNRAVLRHYERLFEGR
ncbi:MAG TPA: flavohemoglobin expression-modulating QEGLA motif protein [Polyangiaceae bacterium]